MPLGKGQQYFEDRNTGMVYTQCKDGTGTDGYTE